MDSRPWALVAYSALWQLALPLVFLRFWLRGIREPEYRQRWRQRLGVWAAPSHSEPRPLIWLHAVSLGETRAAAPLINALRQEISGMRLLLTAGTATGWAAGRPECAVPAGHWAQWAHRPVSSAVERLPYKQDVAGSNPAPGMN